MANPNTENDIENPLYIEISSCSFSNNNGLTDAIIITKTNSIVNVQSSSFQNNFSIGRGSVAFADIKES